MSKSIDVDTKTFVRFWLVILGFVVVALFIWRAWGGILVVGIAAFLAIAIRPLALKINEFFLRKKKKGKEKLSSVLAFLIVIFALIVIVAVIGPVVVNETTKFIGQLPEMFEKTLGGWSGINNFGRNLGIENLQGKLVAAVSSLSDGIVSNFGNMVVTGISTVSGVVAAIGLTIVITLLFLLEGPKLYDDFWKMLTGKRKSASIEEARRTTSRMSGVISTYVSKQVTVALLDGFVTTVVVFVMSLIFGFSSGLAFPMGLVTMIFYLIPMFGQVIGCAIVTLILLFSNPLAAAIFLVFYIVYAQVENNGIAPKIQGDALNLSPLIVLVAITIGMYVAGLVGAIVAIPVAGCIKVLIEEYPRIKELKEK